MPDFKFRLLRTTVSKVDIEHRLKLANLYVGLTRTLQEIAFPNGHAGSGVELELLLVLLCVYIGDAEGRPTTVTKIAGHANLSRGTTYRRLEDLISREIVQRLDKTYHITMHVMTTAQHRRLARIVAQYLTA